jgi:non-specific serine/threonine protein kinase
MGEVWLAEDTRLGRKVALKFLPAEFTKDSQRVRRFTQEAKAASALNHPNIISVHDIGECDTGRFIVMEFVSGKTLRSVIATDNSVETLFGLGKQMAQALSAAHAVGITHRDIKPDNIMLRDDGYVKMLDFGLARLLPATASDPEALTLAQQTTPGTVIGTLAYMSPEQARGQAVGSASDVFALGIVLYELATGRHPFKSETTIGYLHAITSQAPPSLTSHKSDLPVSLDDLILRMLEKAPDARPTAGEVAQALQEIEKHGASNRLQARTILKRVGPTNLPRDRTRFIGRTEDLEYCARLSDDARLLTLAGLGGCGKTRLGIKLAANLSRRFPDGVWFIDLTPLTDPSKVVSAVAQVLSLREEADKNLEDLITDYISNQKILLVLDNCEHLLSACAELVDKLISSCAEVHILATSREQLGVQGERVVALPPLGVPALNSETDLDALRAADAVRLFIDRAQQVQHEFKLTTANAVAVADLCRKLDGIPLAIELAAARLKILSLDQLLARLNDRFRLLSTTGRTVIPRHQTLRTVIEWSYDHLSEEEQRVSRALSVFAGGWNLQLATTVAGGSDEFEMLELHSQLVDKSIVIAERESGGIRRYSFLETVRQFLVEQLNNKGEDKLVRESHFGAMQSLAEQAYAERITKEEYWSEQLGIERDNLRVALECAQPIDSESYLKLVGALAWFWIARTHLFEGREHTKSALASTSVEPLRPARARALWGAAQILAILGNASDGRALMDEALHTWRELGDTRELALALEAVGWTHFFSGKDEEALGAFEECLQLQQTNGDRHLIIRAMVGLAQILVALGRTAEAIPMSREIIDFSKPRNDKRSEHFGWHYLADCELILGHCHESLELYKQSLSLAQAIGDKVEIGCEVQGVAMSLAGLGEKELAVRFAAAVRAEWDRIGVDIRVKFWDALLDRYIGAARQAMTAEDYQEEWSKGRSMPFDEAVTLALGV